MKTVKYLCFVWIGILIGFSSIKAQNVRIDPPNWWIGMEHDTVQLLIEAKDIINYSVEINHKGISILDIHRTESHNYLFVDVYIAPETKAGLIPVILRQGKKYKSAVFQLSHKKPLNERSYGISQKDVMYLLFPDRFSNGDPSNDIIPGMYQESCNRDSLFFRHGGDLQGILNHLDYLHDLGITALWLNPVFENNQPLESFHGYAITDHYAIDPRLGSMSLYKNLIDSCHVRGIKMVKDVIFNHVGDRHRLYKDLPFSDWIHRHDTFTRTSYRSTTLMDPYATDYDKHIMTNGWFDHHMPDLNQKNMFLARYLIQNSIWWIEHTNIDAFRVDTWAYPDQEFMEHWYQAIQREYPNFSIFGETWVHGASVQTWFTGNKGKNHYPSSLTAVTDFQLYYAIIEALTKEQGWTEGISKVYYALAKDFLYKHPEHQVTFLDNHDISRFYSMVGEDLRKFKSGLAFLLTTRGIPCIYYGTEIGMKNFSDPDALVREDFPGGWDGDPFNKFTKEGRNDFENDIFDYLRSLIHWRNSQKAITEGKLKQFVPQNGIYVYGRYHENNYITVVMNTHAKDAEIDLKNYSEIFSGKTKGKLIPDTIIINVEQKISIPAFTTLIIEWIE